MPAHPRTAVHRCWAPPCAAAAVIGTWPARSPSLLPLSPPVSLPLTPHHSSSPLLHLLHLPRSQLPPPTLPRHTHTVCSSHSSTTPPPLYLSLPSSLSSPPLPCSTLRSHPPFTDPPSPPAHRHQSPLPCGPSTPPTPAVATSGSHQHQTASHTLPHLPPTLQPLPPRSAPSQPPLRLRPTRPLVQRPSLCRRTAMKTCPTGLQTQPPAPPPVPPTTPTPLHCPAPPPRRHRPVSPCCQTRRCTPRRCLSSCMRPRYHRAARRTPHPAKWPGAT